MPQTAPMSLSPHFHRFLSLALYLACFFAPGYYHGAQFNPSSSLGSLWIGWLGLMAGYYAWLANPLFAAALFASGNAAIGGLLSAAALALGASFLLHDTILVSEAPSYAPIVAYGWGFAFWLAAPATLLAGELARLRPFKPLHIIFAAFISGASVLLTYGVYDLRATNSPSKVRAARDLEFAKHCAGAAKKINKTADDVRGILLEPDWYLEITKIRQGDGLYVSGAGMLNFRDRNGREPPFIEKWSTRTRQAPQLVRRMSGTHRDLPISSPESTHSVKTTSLNIPPQLDLIGRHIEIKDLRDNTVLASTTYVLDKKSGRHCGELGTRFSTTQFMAEVLTVAEDADPPGQP